MANLYKKDKNMQTDCGGLMITKSIVTYGEADKIAKDVNLEELIVFMKKADNERNDLKWPNSIWPISCYWMRSEKYPDRYFRGKMWWVIYSFLSKHKLIPNENPNSYNNSMEYLYNEILKRLCEEGFVEGDGHWKYFKIN